MNESGSMDLASVLSFRVQRLTFRARDLDLVLALVATFILPVACMLLLEWSGALVPLLIYYGLFCFILVRWRKGSLDYARPMSWVLPLFVFLLFIQLLTQIAGVLTIVPEGDPWGGVLLTLLIWVPLNAFSEQLLWVYIFDSFETRWTERRKRLAGGILGILLTLAFVGLIHALFWGSFLPAFESVAPWSYLFFATQFIITPGYLFLYRRSGSMWPIFALHIIADATLVLAGQYSIVPDLWTL